MRDRLIAVVMGAICGVVMAFLWSFIALRGIGACYTKYPSFAATVGCDIAKGGYWVLLAGPPLIGLVFGSEALLKVLSVLWGTDRRHDV